jgi:DNA-binding beta-propeller fold protein YncE
MRSQAFLILTLVLVTLVLVSCGNNIETTPLNRRTYDSYRGKKNGKNFEIVIVSVYETVEDKPVRIFYRFDLENSNGKLTRVPNSRKLIREAEAEVERQNTKPFRFTLIDFSSLDAPASNHIYIANNDGQNAVVVLNAATGDEIARVNTPSFMSAADLTPDGAILAVNSFASGTPQIQLLDTATNRFTRSVPLPAGTEVSGLHYSPDGTLLYVVDRPRGVRIFSTATYTESAFAAIPSGISNFGLSTISPDGDAIFSLSSNALFDTTSRTFTTAVVTGGSPFGVSVRCAYHPYGHELYCPSGGNLQIINTSTMAVEASVVLPNAQSIRRIATTRDGRYVIVGAFRNVYSVDTTLRQLADTAEFPANTTQSGLVVATP